MRGEYNYAPDWYDVTIRGNGRKYRIPGDPKHNGHHYWGSVIINDDTHTVYVKVVWS